MADTGDLLIEIGTEDLPPFEISTLLQDFQNLIETGLKTANLSFRHITPYATPRRFALVISALSLKQPPQISLKRGPKVSAAFDATGKPTAVALGFAKGCGVDVSALKKEKIQEEMFLVFEQEKPAQITETLIPDIINNALKTMPLAKRMRWGKGDLSFMRPIHWVVLLLDKKIINGIFFDIASNNKTYGHRFLHPQAITLSTPKAYADILEKEGKVIASIEKRQEIILKGIKTIAESRHCQPIIDENLLKENIGLVEWPVVLLGSFDPTFLELPREVLISALQFHQKCFALEDAKGKLLPHFILISNIETQDPREIIKGNELVMHARLADAAFHYKVDKSIRLDERIDKLKHIVFQAKLGSLYDKSQRLEKLSEYIAATLGGKTVSTVSAAKLCKTDLVTQMVDEFPELQGIMGYYYALHDGENEVVAEVIKEHYLPRFAGDTLPESKEGLSLAIADRIDTLVGVFGLGKQPTGDKDPFGLRRQALAVVRMIIEKKLALDLKVLLETSIESYGDLLPKKDISPVLDFCFERLRAFYHEQGVSLRVFDAVLARRPTQPFDFHQRLEAVNHFITLPEATSLSEANKRVRNILIKNLSDENETLKSALNIDRTLLKESAEKKLSQSLKALESEIEPLIKKQDYKKALVALSTLQAPIDTFFTEVMVMVDDLGLRQNRIHLLNNTRRLFLEIADISLL